MVGIWSTSHIFQYVFFKRKKFFNFNLIFKKFKRHSFAETSLAYFRKYPCADRPDVLSVDLIKKEFNPETGILKTRRLITMDINVPGWISKVSIFFFSFSSHYIDLKKNLSKIFGISSRVYFLEDAEVNCQAKTVVTTSRNLSFSNLVESIEKCSYSQHENKKWTLMNQSANVTATGFMAFSSTIEDIMMNTFRNNVNKGREVMEKTINVIKKEAEEGLIWVEGLGNKIRHEGEGVAILFQE